MTFTDLAQSQQEANELGAKPLLTRLRPHRPFQWVDGSGGGLLSPCVPPAATLVQRILDAEAQRLLRANDKRAEERLRIMREAIDRG